MSSAPVRCSARWISSPQLNNGASPPSFTSRVSPCGRARRRVSSLCSFVAPMCCSKNDHGEADAGHVGDAEVVSVDPTGSEQCGGKQSIRSFSSKELLQKLKRYGTAGVLSYGLLNTVYYLSTFLLVWFYFAPAPGRMGYAAAVDRFLKLMAMVWAGSQVTKILRAGGALALAPFVDRGLSWFTVKFKFESETKAFAAIVGLCFGLALLLFLGLTLLWA
ncbi:uncharacterized protein LOC109723927 isoform X1 [Ananas comosus]|uniref:Uncharacterized protein LOC109723927 isoform X1 n=2 Tax=Ananas comosus TaxID=4615 RepID=A0A6P5GHA4_ANACO|nr:uncharacterized protein LOC109723927 isoform X1 [Ananas comosus]